MLNRKYPRHKKCRTILIKIYIMNEGNRKHLNDLYYCRFCDQIIKIEKMVNLTTKIENYGNALGERWEEIIEEINEEGFKPAPRDSLESKMSRKELKKKYPKKTDYKFINE